MGAVILMAAPLSERDIIKLYGTLHRGAEAGTLLAVALPLLERRKEMLVNTAIIEFRGGTLDGMKALLAVAALAENEQLLQDLKALEAAGRRASEKIQQGGS